MLLSGQNEMIVMMIVMMMLVMAVRRVVMRMAWPRGGAAWLALAWMVGWR